jgi:hypothetical protein
MRIYCKEGIFPGYFIRFPAGAKHKVDKVYKVLGPKNDPITAPKADYVCEDMATGKPMFVINIFRRGCIAEVYSQGDEEIRELYPEYFV